MGPGPPSVAILAFEEFEVFSARLFPLAALAIVAISLVGCAGARKRVYTADEMRSELESRVSTQMRDEIVIPFEIDDEIRQLARDVTKDASTDSGKVRAIVRTIIGLAGFSISYDWLSNKTAQEVFREGKGNCLAYSNLFVGMARAVGVDATYADVRFTERITREAEIIVRSTHITAAVRQATGTTGTTLIDFTTNPERKYIGFEVIDDLEAIANFYNNQGFLYGYFTENEDVDFDPLEKELEMYRLALEILPTFHRARNNLGVALRRRGRIDEAIEQYQVAIEHYPKYAEAHSNLGTAYLYQGRTEDALQAFRIAAKNAGRDGYIHHRLGVVYLRLARYQEAIKQFREALSKEPELADAHYHLGECYRNLGDEKKAIEHFEKTLQIDHNYIPDRTRLERLHPSGQPPHYLSGIGRRLKPHLDLQDDLHGLPVAHGRRELPRLHRAQGTLIEGDLEPLGNGGGSHRTIASHQHHENDAALDPLGPRALRIGRLRGLDDSGRQRLFG
jgi:Tfp pilus assembly protein PilF